MRLLVGFNDNSQEWEWALEPRSDYPRLPLICGYGTVFFKRGHEVSGINLVRSEAASGTAVSFKRVYAKREMRAALKNNDAALLWARAGISAVWDQFFLPPPRRRVCLSSYVWPLGPLPLMKTKALGLATQWAARYAKAVILMATEHCEQARRDLKNAVPVIQFLCGVDSNFYGAPATISDVPAPYAKVVETLLGKPYVILQGDQQRLDRDVLDFVEISGIRFVRISQSAGQWSAPGFMKKVVQKGCGGNLFLFEKVSYPFLRFLLQHASAYAGLVDSTWQPAGWTSAVEALTCGIPVVMYEGLVSRDLARLGASEDFLRTAPCGDVRRFHGVIHDLVLKAPLSRREQILSFVRSQLDMDSLANRFAEKIEAVCQ